MTRCPTCGAPASPTGPTCVRCDAPLGEPATRPLRIPTASLPAAAAAAAAPAPALAPTPGRRAGVLLPITVAVLVVLLGVGGLGLVRPDVLGLAAGSPFAPVAGEAPPGTAPIGTDAAPADSAAVASAAEADTADPVAALRSEVGDDRADVEALAGGWVPQLSSKRPGTVDGGRTYDARAILAEHRALREQYPRARLLYSGDWPVFGADDYWVTVLATESSTAPAANAWCDAQGLGSDDCFAKRLAHDGGSATTVHR